MPNENPQIVVGDFENLCECDSPSEHYSANACIVWCFDNRFSGALEKYIAQSESKHYDLVSIAGGAKTLASPSSETDREFVLKQIETSIRLHKTDSITLMNHSDCGAYGGLKAFNNDCDKEREALVAELKKAEEYLKSKLAPEIKINLVYVDFEKVLKVN